MFREHFLQATFQPGMEGIDGFRIIVCAIVRR